MIILLGKKAWEGKGKDSFLSLVTAAYLSVGGEDFLAARKSVEEEMGRI